MRTTLTDLAIRSLKPAERQVEFFCAQTRNFGVRVSPKGTKSFFVMLDRPRRRVHLGKWPAVTLQDARKRARQLLSHPERHQVSMKVGEAIDLYLETRIEPNYRERTAYLTRRFLTKYCDGLRGMELGTLRPTDCTKLFDAILKTPAEANHPFGVLRTFLRWCEHRQLIPRSPLHGISKPAKMQSRERVLSDDEIRCIWHAAGFANSYGTIIRLLILTGQRRGEIVGLRRQDVTDKALVFPITKNGHAHSIPCTTAIREIIDAMAPAGEQAWVGSEYFFPARGGEKPFCGWGKAKMAFDRTCPVLDWCHHDLRRFFATKMAEWEIAPPHVVEALLNHRSGSRSPIQRIYDRHSYLPQMKSALEAYQVRLAECVDATDNVRQLAYG